MSMVSIPQGTIKRGDVQSLIEIPVVSIPQGTIKRHVNLAKTELEYVSIPQGTIKRLLCYRQSLGLSGFNSTRYD